MNPLLFFALCLRIFTNPIANAIQKRLTNTFNYEPLLVNFCTFFLISIALIYPLGYETAWLNFSQEFYFYIFLAGICGSAGNGFLIAALKYGDLSVLGPINSYKAIIGLISAFIFLGEVPNLLGFCGIFVIIFGSFIIFGRTQINGNLLKRRDVKFRLIALLLTGLEATFLKKVIFYSNPEIAFATWAILGAFFSFLLLLFIKKKSEVKKISSKHFHLIIILAALYGTMQLSTNYIFSEMSVALSLSLFQLSSIVSVLIGIIFFKEKHFLRRFLGAVIMSVGAIMIFL